MFRPLVVAVAGTFVLACGSEPPPTATAPTPTSAQPTPAASVVPATAETAMPVGNTTEKEPDGLGMIGRFDGGTGGLALVRPGPPPSIRMGQLVSSGKLPPEIIQRVVRQNLGRIRLCYEDGLRTTPTLAGRVSVTYVIDAKGAVTNAADDGSDLPDAPTVACIATVFGNITYPAPESGTVSVKYPIVFAPAKR